MRRGRFIRWVIASLLTSLAGLAVAAAPGDLQEAASEGDLAKVTALVNNGTPVDELNPRDTVTGTPLTAAILLDIPDVALFLLSRGANPRPSTVLDVPLLFQAAEMKDTRVLQAMLDRGVPVNLVNEGNGETALFAPAREGKGGVVDVLLAHGADPKLRDKKGETPADQAHQIYLRGVQAKAIEDKLRARMN